MGLLPSKEELMITAIEKQDIGAMKALIKDSTPAQVTAMCKYVLPKEQNRCTILHYATWQENPELLSLLLAYADNIELRDGFSWTPLMTAINCGSTANVQLLLECGANINCDNMNGMDLIAMAMNVKNIEIIKTLMDHGAQVTFSSEQQADDKSLMGCYLLHFAVDSGLIDVVRLLVEKGKIPVNTTNQSGWSPLHLAAGHGYLDIVKFLIENGAEVNIKDHDNNTPLAWAKLMKAEEIINELEKQGGILDKEWHGEKPQLHHNLKENQEEQNIGSIGNNKFEIEEPAAQRESTNKSLIILDALQRQR